MKMITRTLLLAGTKSKALTTALCHKQVTSRSLASSSKWTQMWLITLLALVASSPLPCALAVETSTGAAIAAAGDAMAPHAAALAAPATSILEQFSPNCSAVAHVFVAKGIDAGEIPHKPSNEMVLRYCESPSVGTCCTYNMETKMAMQSRLLLEKQSKEQISKLATMLSAKAHKFNEVFLTLLHDSKKEFHNMFTRTYGVIYQQNSYVFSDLFNELENYYARGRVDLIEVMDKFFNTLYQKMFQVLNAQYSYDEKYQKCVGEYMKELKPFGDVPDKLSVQIKRSFVATRTYYHALNTAAEITKRMMNIRLNADCTAALTKMHNCGACKGYTEKPCTNYCINVMKGCLHYFSELESEWDNFASSMDKVAERLLGSFNIVMVVEPINIKISEAIMNFQDHGRDITSRVFQGCGKPPAVIRPKRALNPRWVNAVSTNADVIAKHATEQAWSRVEFPPTVTGQEVDILDIDANPDEAIVLREKRAADPGLRDIGGGSAGDYSSEARGGNSGGGGGGGGGGGRGGGGRNKKKQQQQNRNKNDDNDYGGRSGRDPVLDKLVRDIRQRMKESKKFWAHLPQQICSTENISATTETDNMCWNGHTIDRYMHSITTEHGRNPEFPGNPATTRQTAMVTQQLFYLKNSITNLRNAYNGQDVDWSEQDDPYHGSGAGSGGGFDDEDDDSEGSGLGSPFVPNMKPGLENVDRPSVRLNVDDEDEDDEDRNALQPHTSRPKHVGGPTHHDQDTNDIDEESEDDSDDAMHKGSGKSKNTPMSLRKALLVYLLPLYMAWFGGICAEML